MFGSSLPPVVCKMTRVLFTLFVFAYTEWCQTYIVLCVCFVFLRLVYYILPFLWIVHIWLHIRYFVFVKAILHRPTCVVLAHCNILRVDMFPLSDILSWLQANRSLLLLLLNTTCLLEKQYIPIVYSLVWPDRGSNLIWSKSSIITSPLA